MVFRLHHAGLEASIINSLNENIETNKVRSVAHIGSLFVERDVGGDHPVHAHECLAHRQGTQSSRHPFDLQRHGLGGKAQVLVRNRDLLAAATPDRRQGDTEDEHREHRRTPRE